MLILFRQIGHVLFIDIRRIGDDQIVLQLRQIAEQVGTDRRHVMDQAVGLNVVLGDGQRVRGDIYRIDFRLREGIGAGDGDAAATGAHIRMCCGLWLISPANWLLISSPIGERGTSTRSST